MFIKSSSSYHVCHLYNISADFARVIQDPAMNIVAAVAEGNVQKVKHILNVRPDWVS